MDRPQITAYFQHLGPAVRVFAADSTVAPEKRERARQLLLAHDGAPALGDLSAVIGQDRAFSPVCQILSAIYSLHLEDVPGGGDFGGLARATAARIGIGTGECNLFTRSFEQLLQAKDPAWVASAVRPLALRSLEEGLRMPWRSVFRDLLTWDDFRSGTPGGKASRAPRHAKARRRWPRLNGRDRRKSRRPFTGQRAAGLLEPLLENKPGRAGCTAAHAAAKVMPGCSLRTMASAAWMHAARCCPESASPKASTSRKPFFFTGGNWTRGGFTGAPLVGARTPVDACACCRHSTRRGKTGTDGPWMTRICLTIAPPWLSRPRPKRQLPTGAGRAGRSALTRRSLTPTPKPASWKARAHFLRPPPSAGARGGLPRVAVHGLQAPAPSVDLWRAARPGV